MQWITNLRNKIFSQQYRWLLEDINYFTDSKKYPSQSPIQRDVRDITWYMQSGMVMGALGTIALCISIRRNGYGAFRYFSYKRALFQLTTLLTFTSLILHLNTLKSKQHIVKIKKDLIETNSPVLLDYLRSRLYTHPDYSEYDVLKDIFTVAQYNLWKDKSKIELKI